MRYLFLLLTLTLVTASAQPTLRSPFYAAGLQGAAGTAGGYDPLSVATLLAWYKPATYYTNGTTATWPDQKSSFHLTNAVGSSAPVGTNDGTRSYVIFDGVAAYLRCAAYTNAQRIEMWFAANVDLANRYLFDSISSTYRVRVIEGGGTPPIIDAIAGAELKRGLWLMQDWRVYTFVFNGADSYVLTNGVLAGTAGNAGANNQSGLTLASPYNLASFGTNNIGEILTYTETNGGAARAAIMNYLKTNNVVTTAP